MERRCTHGAEHILYLASLGNALTNAAVRPFGTIFFFFEKLLIFMERGYPKPFAENSAKINHFRGIELTGKIPSLIHLGEP